MIQSQVSRFFGGISFSFLLPLREKARMRGTLIGTLTSILSHQRLCRNVITARAVAEESRLCKTLAIVRFFACGSE